jgi:carbamoylphosphate synthase large subunit
MIGAKADVIDKAEDRERSATPWTRSGWKTQARVSRPP